MLVMQIHATTRLYGPIGLNAYHIIQKLYETELYVL